MIKCPHIKHNFNVTEDSYESCDGHSYVELGDMAKCEYFQILEETFDTYKP